MKLFFNFFLYLLFLFPILYTEIAFSANNPNEWENHSENIEILDIEEIMEIVSSRSAILIDVWKKDKKPDVIDIKNGFLLKGIQYLILFGFQILEGKL